ncbi:MAG: pseudouridine synthase, partial [Comamonadaceae bacterium]
YYYRAIEAEPVLPFEATVLHHDDHLLVVDKPHFVPVTPGGRYLQQSLLVRLKRQLGIDALVPVHRIDRETAGLVLFSTRPATRAHYAALFSGRTIRKRYEAIVPWTAGQVLPSVHRSRLVPDDAFVRTREVPGEPNAETSIELMETGDGRARLALRPLTGRRHQLRVQCAALGVPILNDRIYPEWLPEGSDDFERPLQLLAATLAFMDPVSGAERHFESRRCLRLDAPGPPAMPGGSTASSNHCPPEPRRGESS